MKTISQSTLILVIVIFAFTSCTKKDSPLPITDAPKMIDISISGESLIYNITIFFNEGVYSNNDNTGDLTTSSLSVTIDGEDVIIESYVVSHSACQKNAKIRVVLNKEPSGIEIITIQPATCLSIYNFDGRAMCISEKISIAIMGSIRKFIIQDWSKL